MTWRQKPTAGRREDAIATTAGSQWRRAFTAAGTAAKNCSTHGTPGKYYTGPDAPTDQFKSHAFNWLAEIRENPVTPESFRAQEQAAHP